MLNNVLSRLERDLGEEIVKTGLSLLACSRHGLFVSDIIQCLAVPPSLWTLVFLSLKIFLRAVGQDNEGRVDFFHQQLSKAGTLICHLNFNA